MDTAVAAALAEILATLAAMAPEHEGLRDFQRLNLQPETLTEVQASLQDYDRRVAKLLAAQASIEALLADGYPALDPRKIADAALEDLQQNARTVEAALARFASNAATRLSLAAAETEEK